MRRSFASSAQKLGFNKSTVLNASDMEQKTLSASWIKWRILIVTLPFTALFGGAKWAIHRLGWEVWSFSSLTQALFAAATLVIAFILSGTLSDYRDSEQIPESLCSAIEAINDGNLLASGGHPDYNPQPLTQALQHILQTIQDWLAQEKDANGVFEAIAALTPHFVTLEKFHSAPLMSRVLSEQAKLRSLIIQIQSIRDTNFVAPAYAIAELFIVATTVSLLLVESPNFAESLPLASLLFTAFVYLLIFIRDLDNPFQYNSKSSADVGLSALQATLTRLEKSLTSEFVSAIKR